ncbi:hypothetical protein [Micromonospora haikouensis]|uniref:hypothetical protein n=1 Tax=Micromonospora haikouensis TaxID=686309 RepID=UPI003D945D72
MAKGDVDTYHEDGRWKNRPEGNQQASSTHDPRHPGLTGTVRGLTGARRAMHARRAPAPLPLRCGTLPPRGP